MMLEEQRLRNKKALFYSFQIQAGPSQRKICTYTANPTL